VINQEMRKLIKSILPEVGVEDLKIRPRGDNRCESANSMITYFEKELRNLNALEIKSRVTSQTLAIQVR
jgi:hypothetical protein